jgi:hypothetical protein
MPLLGCSPPPGTRMKAYNLAKGDAGVIATIRMMENLTAGPEGVGSPVVHFAVRQAVRGTVRDDASEIEAWFAWVKHHIQFRGEAEETLQSPEVTVKLRAGDCDDMAMLLAAGLKSLGYETAFKVIATPESEGEYAHVYAVVEDKKTKKWVPLDPTVQESYPGWEAPDSTRAQTFEGLMAYAPGNFRTTFKVPPQPRMLGWYRRGNVRPLGYLGQDEGSGPNYGGMLATQSVQEVPAIIGAITGVQTSTTTAAGTTSTGSNILAPYAAALGSSQSLLWILGLGAVVLVIAMSAGGGGRH